MNRNAILSLCLWTCATTLASAQTPESLKPSSYTFQLARILLRDGTIREGWFLGTYRDSLVIQVGTKSHRYSRYDLLRVDIDAKPDRGQPALVGMVAGMYLGSALFLNAEHGPTLFLDREYRDPVGLLLPGAVFLLAGGGFGYLAGLSLDRQTEFEFTGNEGENAALWEELSEGGSDARRRPTIHLSVQGSWVRGPLPTVSDEHTNSGYASSQATSLNLVRRIQLTYSVTNFLDVGLSAVWLGQPTVQQTMYSPDYGNVSQEMSGRGYYAVGVFQPLWKSGWRDVQWDVAAGVGLATIDLQTVSQHYTYPPEPSILIGKKGTIFSATVSTELKVFITNYFTLGLAADLVYIPEDVPDVPGFTFESGTLGTRSIGFVLGLHI